MIDLEFMKRAKELAKPIAEECRINENLRTLNWRKNNPEKWKACIKSLHAKRRGRISYSKVHLSREQKAKVTEFYMKCPEGHHVDHIIPLSKGGIHCIENLQYLTASENSQKSDKWIGLWDGECYSTDPEFIATKLQEMENLIFFGIDKSNDG